MIIFYYRCVIDFFALTFGKFKAADGEELYEPMYFLGYLYIAVFALSFAFGFWGALAK